MSIITDNYLTEDMEKTLRNYAVLLGKCNERARLTGPSDPEILYAEHIADALPGLPYLPAEGSFVDVGTGGGLPGMVWGICRPDLKGTLLDSIGRKSKLVEEMAIALGCSNIDVVNMRSEDFARTHRERFDVATARAVAHACILAEYLSPLVKPGGRLIAFKGPGAAEEVRIPPAKWNVLGLSKPALHPYRTAGKDRFLVIWEKVSRISRQYPRNPGLAEKKPWCGLPEKEPMNP